MISFENGESRNITHMVSLENCESHNITHMVSLVNCESDNIIYMVSLENGESDNITKRQAFRFMVGQGHCPMISKYGPSLSRAVNPSFLVLK